MATEYRLTLAGETPISLVAARALPDPADSLTPYEDILSADLYKRHGFEVAVGADQGSFYGAEADTGQWVWEPATSVDVTFRMDVDSARRKTGTRDMLEAVGRVLASGPEDAALTLDDDTLLLTRVDGTVRRHRQSWWDHNAYANEIIPG
jgi:hypothetical protein